jgi:CO dehydrogenase/acetyl-CoA synthase alpha subunit
MDVLKEARNTLGDMLIQAKEPIEEAHAGSWATTLDSLEHDLDWAEKEIVRLRLVLAHLRAGTI